MQSRDQQRLLKIRDYCDRILRTVARCGESYDIFASDEDRQQSAAFAILQIGELVGGLSDEYRDATKAAVEWSKIKAMRNIIVHNYGDVKLKIVWSVATVNIPELRQFCNEQLVPDE